MLVSVHFPKASGTALSVGLASIYGARLSLDYSEDPALPQSPASIDPENWYKSRSTNPDFDAVHGHFHPMKYDHLKARRFTILRDPVSLLFSILYFWRSSTGCGVLRDYVVDRGYGVLELAQIPLIRRLMSETYFGNYDMNRFDLIGRYENRRESLAKLSALIDAQVDDVSENVTPANEQRQNLEADASIRRKLTDLLADDVRFYERWAFRDL